MKLCLVLFVQLSVCGRPYLCDPLRALYAFSYFFINLLIAGIMYACTSVIIDVEEMCSTVANAIMPVSVA